MMEKCLLVKPTYKPGWDLPGGMVEANEPPHDAAMRELKEELGLAVTLRDVLIIDWVSPHGPWDDQISFVFDAGTLSEDQAAGIRPHDDELSEVAFLSPERACELLGSRLRDRFQAALKALADGHPRYLHDARAIW